MSRLSSNSNVYNTCLRLIRKKGYKLNLEGDQEEDGMIIPESLTWFAEKDGYEFLADNPIELLGLVSIHEKAKPLEDKPYWWMIGGKDIYEELIEKTFCSRSTESAKSSVARKDVS